LRNKLRFTPIESIDRNTKKANIQALHYYVSEKIEKIRKSLISKRYNEWVLRDYPEIDPNERNFVNSVAPLDLPLSVVLKYKQDLIKYKNACLLDYSEKSFSRYIGAIEKTDTFLDWSNDEISGLKKIENRFCSSYRKKVIKRTNWLMWEYGNENCCLLTLTLDPKLF
ncbi:unnamed protein product, partial [marine sediment metagenome]